jgi:hypothetical protein
MPLSTLAVEGDYHTIRFTPSARDLPGRSAKEAFAARDSQPMQARRQMDPRPDAVLNPVRGARAGARAKARATTMC